MTTITATKPRTTEQNAWFHALINELRYTQDEKIELVRQFSGYRTDRSSELTFSEMHLLIAHLESEKTNSIKRMRSKIINIAKDIGLTNLTPNPSPCERGAVQVDFVKLNKFLVDKFKKPLHLLTRAELPAAVTAMERWRDSNMRKELAL